MTTTTIAAPSVNSDTGTPPAGSPPDMVPLTPSTGTHTPSATSANPTQTYVATHYAGTLPAAEGCIAEMFERNMPQEQCALERTFRTLLLDPHMDLWDQNGDQIPFADMFSVPGAQKVKLLYGIGYGTDGIGKVLPIINSGVNLRAAVINSNLSVSLRNIIIHTTYQPHNMRVYNHE